MSSNCKVDLIMMYVDLVSVIMAMCSRMFNIASSCKYVHEQQQFPGELSLPFMVLWWTAGGVKYGSPCYTVVVGSYSC